MPGPAAAVPALDLETTDVDDDQGLVLDGLAREQVRNWRARAMQDHQIVFDHIDRYSEPAARRLFSNQLIELGARHFQLGHLDLGCPPGGKA
ncbi:hypothetical protein [Streptomyces microflavus]|uniref:hypothetical protein n=1 Tax=Streptomyces microflavus TaxID=1919 RepID=UPI0036E1788A